ncbi:type II toxin-antitoxin system antitoxin SocA domain-containing protein [Streptobacillus felis]|uniref:DUF4065 domain-containing protein n=1 Tax=Streptobacillus felis TaxID=1384509 RepID=A0A7Z0TAD7_9FUSO|nr:type II toxin-antitoxin system antitoxin SocA domain-containing protein [Streptobacillus felis]NYV27907.1 DUF4065 domain-containing protein [Streptobacillus felis]
MEKIIEVARYIKVKFEEIYGKEIDEIRLQKLVYFSQRESILYTGKVLFLDAMKAWRYGPVSIKVRKEYRNMVRKKVNIKTFNKYLINNVIQKYGHYSAGRLINLTHREKAWKYSRKNLSKDDRGFQNIHISLIFDEKERVYDTYWDMYCDEFKDFIGDIYDR